MKRVFLIISLVVLVACTSPVSQSDNSDTADNSDAGQELGTLVSIAVTPEKSLFTGKIDLNTTSQTTSQKSISSLSLSSSDYISTLLYINSAGDVVPVIFVDSNGNQVILAVNYVQQLGDDIIVGSYTGFFFGILIESGFTKTGSATVSGNFLVNFSSNKIFDLAGYNVHDCYYSNGILFIVKDGTTVYRIDLSNMSNAVPLNNPFFNATQNIRFLLNNKLIVGAYALDPTGSIPPKIIVPVTPDAYPGAGGVAPHDWNTALVVDGLGQLWGIRIGGGGYDVPPFFYYRMTIDDNGITVIPTVDGVQDVHEYTVPGFLNSGSGVMSIRSDLPSGQDLSRPATTLDIMWSSWITGEGGVIYVNGDASGGLSFSSTPITFTSDAPNSGQVFIDNSMYWILSYETKIFKMNLLTGVQSVEYTSPSLVTLGSAPSLLSVTGGKLAFYQYDSATSVSSYVLVPGTNSPQKISTFQMDIEYIVELNF